VCVKYIPKSVVGIHPDMHKAVGDNARPLNRNLMRERESVCVLERERVDNQETVATFKSSIYRELVGNGTKHTHTHTQYTVHTHTHT
jgi:hypothetical protein